MVKKKGKSKRTTLKDKYKIQKRVKETHRKRKKQQKLDKINGKVVQKKKDPGIPNSWPFKQDLLKQIQVAKDRQEHQVHAAKEKRKLELRALRDHQKGGGSARTVEELLAQAQSDQTEFARRDATSEAVDDTSAEAAGQSSRKAYYKELNKVIDNSDVLLQILDARDPLSTRLPPNVEDSILSKTDKRMVLVLNKIDLVPKSVVGSWLTYLRRSHPTIAIKASSYHSSNTEDATTSSSPVGMESILQLLKNYARSGDTKTTISVGVIGYPNVGKSSIINALKRSRSVGVSPRPGFTKQLQEVVLDKNIHLLDSPGVVFDDTNAVLGNGVDVDALSDPIPAIDSLLKRCDLKSLIMTYSIPAFPKDNAMVFLALVAKRNGRVLKGGIPDKMAAARSVLKDWNTGKIPYYTVPPVADVGTSGATVVSQFAAEFDLSKLDDEVMGSLKETDEMDFVQLHPENDDDDDDDDAMETDNPHAVARAKLAKADDYDFDQL